MKIHPCVWPSDQLKDFGKFASEKKHTQKNSVKSFLLLSSHSDFTNFFQWLSKLAYKNAVRFFSVKSSWEVH